MKRRKVNYEKGLWGSGDRLAQINSESYEWDHDLEAENGMKLYYFHQFNYIPARNQNGAAKIHIFSTRGLRKTNP